jgi:hypothetical protein
MLNGTEAAHHVANRTVLVADDGTRGTAVALGKHDDDDTIMIVKLVASGVNGWYEAADLTADDTLTKCGRCNSIVPKDSIDTTGPYLTCPPCTEIIRK